MNPECSKAGRVSLSHVTRGVVACAALASLLAAGCGGGSSSGGGATTAEDAQRLESHPVGGSADEVFGVMRGASATDFQRICVADGGTIVLATANLMGCSEVGANGRRLLGTLSIHAPMVRIVELDGSGVSGVALMNPPGLSLEELRETYSHLLEGMLDAFGRPTEVADDDLSATWRFPAITMTVFVLIQEESGQAESGISVEWI